MTTARRPRVTPIETEHWLSLAYIEKTSPEMGKTIRRKKSKRRADDEPNALGALESNVRFHRQGRFVLAEARLFGEMSRALMSAAAHCSIKDEFDLGVGEAIALRRVLDRFINY